MIGWTPEDTRLLERQAVALERIALALRDVADVALASEVKDLEPEPACEHAWQGQFGSVVESCAYGCGAERPMGAE